MSDFEFISAEEYAKRQTGLTRKYSIFIVLLDPEKSEIGKILDIKVPGAYYAVKPK